MKFVHPNIALLLSRYLQTPAILNFIFKQMTKGCDVTLPVFDEVRSSQYRFIT